MTEKVSDALQALAVFVLSIAPFLAVALRGAWLGRRKVRYRRIRGPP